MRRRRANASVSLALALTLALGPVPAFGAASKPKGVSRAEITARRRAIAEQGQKSRITQAQREAAADRMAQQKSDARSSARVRAQASIVPTPGGVPDYFGSANWAFSPPLRKFVDTLPLLGPEKANGLGQYIPVAKPDTVTYPGSDYYEIELRQFKEKMHSDLEPTTLRGYVQVNKGTDTNGQNTLAPDPIHQLGPFIIARKGRPVRIKFTNKLPTGQAGDLFIPVDKTVMGAGMGPLGMDAGKDASGNMLPMDYSQNRATLHEHGGLTPWISDGTPHQWITPAGEKTAYPKGVSVQNVPDMPDPGDGSQTFFYTNDQSARLQFYHDHSYGITRLNVYSGEAAGYMITDATEDKLIAEGTIPSEQLPMIVQDKTFVDTSTVRATDPTWNWGTGQPDASGVRPPVAGDLWYPHVYSPAQNPADLSGMNAFGRWHYGPWFWPPTTNIKYPPVPNPYYDPANAPWEPELMPAVPNPSMAGETFMDTAIVNGTAFPTLEVDPKAYRLRILNASNDRFWNLQMYEADPTTMSSDGRTDTEVKMVPASNTATNFPASWPKDGREGGVPDPDTAGPDWIQIGTESGFLPKPAIIPAQPITWNMNQSAFTFGNVDQHSLLLGPAERADAVVDFSGYAGKTLIVYNDAPAPFPAIDPRVDYYAGAPDLRDTGGHAGPKVGFGPNTRTVMQIKVKDATPAAAFDLAKLNTAFASTATTPGVFASSQHPIVVPEARYNEAYNASFPVDPYVRIFDTQKTFKTIAGNTVTVPFEPKAIQDEMGEAFDTEYGRMSGKLGVELPGTNAGNQNFVLQNFIDPATEDIKLEPVAGVPVAGDGTQIWKITHNGVDTHPIHWHAFDLQLINRVGWDNEVIPPDDNELGWKETIRVNPLSDTIVALRPIKPKTPFGVPESVRLLDPTMPEGSTIGFTNIDPKTGQPLTTPVVNKLTNFGWEYVWHCHILSHEEMDMMRPISASVPSTLPAKPTLTATRTASGVDLTWTDGTPKNAPATLGNPASEIGFRVERATYGTNGAPGPFSVITTALANATAYRDAAAAANGRYLYRVTAFNAAGAVKSNTAGIGLNGTFRVYGASRYDTAISAAREAFPDWEAVTDIVLASGADPMVDSLPAAGLGKAYNAPVLLCPPNSLPTSVSAAIEQAGGSKTVNLHLVGNTFDAATRTKLAAIPGVSPTLDRVYGVDRYGTSQEVAKRMRTLMGVRQGVLFANGENAATFFDATLASVIAAGKGYPVLLVRGASVPPNTLSTVSAIGATERYLIGSTANVTEANRGSLGVTAANRWTGADYYAEAVTVANNAAAKGWLSKTKVGIASSVPDGISGGSATGSKGGVLLLTSGIALANPARDFLVANKATIAECRVYGSNLAINDPTFNAIVQALQ